MTGDRAADAELIAIERAAVELAAGAGALLQRLYAGPLDVRFKSKRGKDPVTEADEAAEALIRDGVAARFPSHGFLGEEGGASAGAADCVWVVDPLDGTANFANGLPLFASSIGVLRHGRPVVAALYTSFGPEGKPSVLHARLGGGLYLDGKRYLAPSRQLSGRSRLSGVPAGLQRGFSYRHPWAVPPGETRSLGSIAVELGLVATGALQYALFSGPKIWDVAAGVLLVQEAGGMVATDARGRWRRLDRFEPPPSRALQDWKQAVAAGDPTILRAQIPRLNVRHAPVELAERILGRRRVAAARATIQRLQPKWRQANTMLHTAATAIERVRTGKTG